MEPIENNPDYVTREAHEVRTLDTVAQLARILANRMVAGPEKTRLQYLLVRNALAFARSLRAGEEEEKQEAEQPQETLSYTLPNGHPQSVSRLPDLERHIKHELEVFTQQLERSPQTA